MRVHHHDRAGRSFEMGYVCPGRGCDVCPPPSGAPTFQDDRWWVEFVEIFVGLLLFRLIVWCAGLWEPWMGTTCGSWW